MSRITALHAPSIRQPDGQWRLLTSTSTEADAERLVRRLTAAGVAHRHLRIDDQQLPPADILHRYSSGPTGLAAGAWLGLLIGVLLGLFTPDHAWLAVLLVGLLIGATWGAVFGFLAHALTHRRRHVPGPAASDDSGRYVVYVHPSAYRVARRAVRGTGRAPLPPPDPRPAPESRGEDFHASPQR